MDSAILFKEKQRFNQWWLWLIFIGINGLFIYGFYVQIIEHKIFGGKPMSNTGIIISTCVSLILTFLFYFIGLETVVKEDGIYVRFFPFQRKYKYFAWHQLSKTFIRSYTPLVEYGGWGLRFSLTGNGTAYNVSGKMGLQLEIESKGRILIGTQKPQELNKVLEQLGKIKI